MRGDIAVLAGDGVGPEVVAPAVAVLHAVSARFGHDFHLAQRQVGAEAILREGEAISQETFDICRRSDAIVFGSVGSLPQRFVASGGPRPEDALLRLRRGLDLCANIRPITVWPELIAASPLREDRVVGVDIVFVREMSAGLYYGFSEDTDDKPSRIMRIGAEDVAVDTLRYTRSQIERVLRVAFEQASRRRRKLTSVDKANLLSSSVLWRRCVEELRPQYPDVAVEHMLVDACAMNLAINPGRFDVVVTENLFGDILTDEAAVVTGSVGLLPSASLVPGSGARFGLYEPIHGSAPDIAGQDKANPLGSILSVALLLRMSLGLEEEAEWVERAVTAVLGRGLRTPDIATPDCRVVGTRAMGDAVARAVREGNFAGGDRS